MTDEVARVCSTDMSLLMPSRAIAQRQFHLITRMPNLRFGIRELPLEGKPCNARLSGL